MWHMCAGGAGAGGRGPWGGAGPGADPPSPAAPHAPRTHRTRATPPLRAVRSRRHSARASQPRHTSALRGAARSAVPTSPYRRCRAEPSVCVQCLTVGNFWCLRSWTKRFCEIERSVMLGLRSGGKTIWDERVGVRGANGRRAARGRARARRGSVRGSCIRVDTGARDGRQADRRRRRGALQPPLEQPPGAPAALLWSAAARRNPRWCDPGLRRAPSARTQSPAWRLQSAVQENLQWKSVQASRDRVKRLSRMGSAGGGRLHVPRRGISGTGTAGDRYSRGRIPAGPRAGWPGSGRAGEVTSADTAGEESGADYPSSALAACQPRKPSTTT